MLEMNIWIHVLNDRDKILVHDLHVERSYFTRL